MPACASASRREGSRDSARLCSFANCALAADLPYPHIGTLHIPYIPYRSSPLDYRIYGPHISWCVSIPYFSSAVKGLMGKDVFGTERFACSKCECKSYSCVIDHMTDEERAMTVVHHPRNHPGYVTCTCGHTIAEHATSEGVETPPAASGELRKCPSCLSRAGACKQPGADNHLAWISAYCPKCFTRPNPKGCKKLGEATRTHHTY